VTITQGNIVLITTITHSYSTKVLTKSETNKMKILVFYVAEQEVTFGLDSVSSVTFIARYRNICCFTAEVL